MLGSHSWQQFRLYGGSNYVAGIPPPKKEEINRNFAWCHFYRSQRSPYRSPGGVRWRAMSCGGRGDDPMKSIICDRFGTVRVMGKKDGGGSRDSTSFSDRRCDGDGKEAKWSKGDDEEYPSLNLVLRSGRLVAKVIPGKRYHWSGLTTPPCVRLSLTNVQSRLQQHRHHCSRALSGDPRPLFQVFLP